MSEFPHDDFAKSFLTELLSLIGKAKANHSLKSETLAADLWFEFNPQQADQIEQLGLLGKLMIKDSLIEVFRNAATLVEIRSCQSKLSHWENHLINQAKRRKAKLKERDLPELWLIMPTASQAIRRQFGATPTAHPGVYRFPQGQRVSLIVVHQLSLTEETRWLRMLGRNGNQQRAIGEFSQSSTGNELYASIEEILASYHANLASRRQLTPEEEALIMQLSEAYLKKRQEWKEEGLMEGRQEGRQETLQQVLAAMQLLRQGIEPESIAQTTGLPIATIEQLSEQLN
jgi:hypothetical protein